MSSLTFVRLGLRADQLGRERSISMGATILMTIVGIGVGSAAGGRQALLHTAPAAFWGVLITLSLGAQLQGRMRVMTQPEERDFLRAIHVPAARVAWLKLMQQIGSGGWMTVIAPAALVAWGVRSGSLGWLWLVPLWPLLLLTVAQAVQGIWVWVDDTAARAWWQKLLRVLLALLGVAGMFAGYGAAAAGNLTRSVGSALGQVGGPFVTAALQGESAAAVLGGLAGILLTLGVIWGVGRLLAIQGYRHVLALDQAESHLTLHRIAPPRNLLRDRGPLGVHLRKNLTLLGRVAGPILTGLLVTTGFLLGLLWFTTRGLHGDSASPTLLRTLSASLLGLYAYLVSSVAGPSLMKQDTGWLGVIRASNQLLPYALAQAISGAVLALPSMLLLAVMAGITLGLPLLPLLIWGLEAVGLMVPLAIWTHALTLRLGGDPQQPNMITALPGLLSLYPVLGFAAGGAALGWSWLTLLFGPLAVVAGGIALAHAVVLLRSADLP